MAGNHGGKRQGAGRKPSPERQKLAALAREHTPAALNALADVAADSSAPPSLRARAASTLLHRGYGKHS